MAQAILDQQNRRQRWRMFDELSVVAIDDLGAIHLPFRISSKEKYSAFLQYCNTEIKFDHFIHSYLGEILSVDFDRLFQILKKIADHLSQIHEGNNECFELVVEMLVLMTDYIKRLVSKELITEQKKHLDKQLEMSQLSFQTQVGGKFGKIKEVQEEECVSDYKLFENRKRNFFQNGK